jgi:hypothetical protein
MPAVPKPKSRPKKLKKPLRRSPVKRGQKPIKRTPIRKKKRSASEFARIYGSKERVLFIKSLPCVMANWVGQQCEGVTENAHTEIEGMGRKAGYLTIVPACHIHNDKVRRLFRDIRQSLASQTEMRWQDFSASRALPAAVKPA